MLFKNVLLEVKQNPGLDIEQYIEQYIYKYENEYFNIEENINGGCYENGICSWYPWRW